jgi:hypothetical protein
VLFALKGNIVPTINLPRRILDALRARVKSELDRMIIFKKLSEIIVGLLGVTA